MAGQLTRHCSVLKTGFGRYSDSGSFLPDVEALLHESSARTILTSDTIAHTATPATGCSDGCRVRWPEGELDFAIATGNLARSVQQVQTLIADLLQTLLEPISSGQRWGRPDTAGIARYFGVDRPGVEA